MCLIVGLAVLLVVLLIRTRARAAADANTLLTEQVVQDAIESRREEQVRAERKPPEIERLVALVEGFRTDPTKQWDALIAEGDMYRKGAFPRFLPNTDVALECFKVAARCPDGKIAGLGQERYIEVHTDPIPTVDQAGGELPTEHGERICELALNAINALPYSAFERPRKSKLQPAVAPARTTRAPDAVQDFFTRDHPHPPTGACRPTTRKIQVRLAERARPQRHEDHEA